MVEARWRSMLEGCVTVLGIQRYMHTGVFGCVSMTVCVHSVCRCIGTYIYQYMQVCAPGGLPWGSLRDGG